MLSPERYVSTAIGAIEAANAQGRVIPSSAEIRPSLIGLNRQRELTGFYLTRTLAVYLAPGKAWSNENVADDQKDSLGRIWEFEVSSLPKEVKEQLVGKGSDVALSVDLQKCIILESKERVSIRALPGAVKIHEKFPQKARVPGKINSETGLVTEATSTELASLSSDEQKATLFRVDGNGVRPVFLYGYPYSKFTQSIVTYYDQNKVADVPFVGISDNPPRHIPTHLLRAAIAELKNPEQMKNTAEVLRILEHS